ncbi:MAG: RnfABCDGE type electron transport complex subunit B [Eubacteriales bacterium]|nr:RnfABCDGE type electron transport complex subunit B [Eubacteriales bacterium]
MFEAFAWPAALIGGMGLLFGVLLAVASKFFSVQGDPRIDQVRECLPGANCGACGFPGCDGLAKAIVETSAPINSCTVASADALKKIAGLVGSNVSEFKQLTAVVGCLSNEHNMHIKYNYQGLEDCAAAAAVAEGYKACRFSCLGFGNCMKVCPTDAISIREQVAFVDEDKCIACGKCATACPRGIIMMLPKDAPVVIQCRSHSRGKEVRDSCNVGCISCGLCERNCKFGAIKIIDNLPVIDYEKCRGCMICAEKCPRKCIWLDPAMVKKAFVNPDKCTACGKCNTACAFGAILGDAAQIRQVQGDACVGCGLCKERCPTGAITLIKQ